MAGSYMDAPADRAAYDRDGSLLTSVSYLGDSVAWAVSSMRIVNSEAGNTVALPSGAAALALLFPIPMDLFGVFVAIAGSNALIIETSPDTTNGVDGVWTTLTSSYVPSVTVSPLYRTETNVFRPPVGPPTQHIRGMRIRRGAMNSSGLSGAQVAALHVYANPSSTATKERLEFWNAAGTSRVGPTHFDWGDVPRGSSADKSFRIKNLSASRTASGVSLYVEALTTVLPSLQGMFLLSDNGGSSFLNTLDLGNLGPGAMTPVLVVRRIIPLNASVSTWSVRLVADVTSWE